MFELSGIGDRNSDPAQDCSNRAYGAVALNCTLPGSFRASGSCPRHWQPREASGTSTRMRHRVAAALLLVTTALLPGCQWSEDNALSVVVSLLNETVAGAARGTVLVDYSASGARILEEDGGPACAFILPGISGQFSDDSKGTLTIDA